MAIDMSNQSVSDEPITEQDKKPATKRGTRSATKGKERVQFDFSEETLQRLDEIMKKTGAATRVEAMRNALRAYDWLVDFRPEDSIKVTRKSDKDEEKDEEIVSALKAKVFR
jgi:hypothetical protein